MSPKPRNQKNRGLPARWRHKHGAYYFRVPKGLESEWDGKIEFRLGVTLAEAYQTWARRLPEPGSVRLMEDLLDRYAQEVVPCKAPKTQESNRISLRRLRAVFGQVPVAALKPRHAYRYRDEVTRKHGAASANRDLEVLSHSLSKAVEWGIVERNSIKGQVRKNKIARRERYIKDWELLEALKVAQPVLRAYIVVKLLTGLRRGDLLRVSISDLQDDGIHVATSKTGAKLIIEWSPELRSAVEFALESRPVSGSSWLFCTRKGSCYVKRDGSASAFDSMWQRFMARALRKTSIIDRFQEKDLRKKTASDMNLEEAQALLGHATPDTTIRHYRLQGTRVRPHSVDIQLRKASCDNSSQ